MRKKRNSDRIFATACMKVVRARLCRGNRLTKEQMEQAIKDLEDRQLSLWAQEEKK